MLFTMQEVQLLGLFCEIFKTNKQLTNFHLIVYHK